MSEPAKKLFNRRNFGKNTETITLDSLSGLKRGDLVTGNFNYVGLKGMVVDLYQVNWISPFSKHVTSHMNCIVVMTFQSNSDDVHFTDTMFTYMNSSPIWTLMPEPVN